MIVPPVVMPDVPGYRPSNALLSANNSEFTEKGDNTVFSSDSITTGKNEPSNNVTPGVNGANSAESASFPRVDQAAIGMQWGKGIKGQGLPYEDYVASISPADTRLPANFKTFDFFDKETGVATSVKTLDTTTAAKLSDPRQVYASLKSNVDATVNFEKTYSLSGVTLDPKDITSRVVDVAVPSKTTSAQWAQIQKAIDYAASKNVTLKITVTK